MHSVHQPRLVWSRDMDIFYFLFAEELVSAIHKDIEEAKRLTLDPANQEYRNHSFFSN